MERASLRARLELIDATDSGLPVFLHICADPQHLLRFYTPPHADMHPAWKTEHANSFELFSLDGIPLVCAYLSHVSKADNRAETRLAGRLSAACFRLRLAHTSPHSRSFSRSTCAMACRLDPDAKSGQEIHQIWPSSSIPRAHRVLEVLVRVFRKPPRNSMGITANLEVLIATLVDVEGLVLALMSSWHFLSGFCRYGGWVFSNALPKQMHGQLCSPDLADRLLNSPMLVLQTNFVRASLFSGGTPFQWKPLKNP